MAAREVVVVPEPKKLSFTGRWFEFDGVNLPEFLSREFGVPRGSWRIVKVEGEGSGLEVGGEGERSSFGVTRRSATRR